MPRSRQEAALAAMFGGEEPEEITFPLKEAQRDVLRELAAHADPTRVFHRGDFVRYVIGCGPFIKRAKEGMLLMYWRKLDFENDADACRLSRCSDNEIGQLSNVDCLLVRYDGSAIVFDVASSELLEPDNA